MGVVEIRSRKQEISFTFYFTLRDADKNLDCHKGAKGAFLCITKNKKQCKQLPQFANPKEHPRNRPHPPPLRTSSKYPKISNLSFNLREIPKFL